jgi:hypothetical protein
MSQFVGAFEVVSKLTGRVLQCRFSHLWNGIATRHSDTIDTKFFVDGEALVVAARRLRSLREDRAGPDRPRSQLHRRRIFERTPEEGDERKMYDVTAAEVTD